MKKNALKITALLMLTALFFNLCACNATLSASAANLMDGINANSVKEKSVDDKFIKNAANFYVELFKKTQTAEADLSDKTNAPQDTNTLISPLSVLLALAMTANGADGETLAEMEKLLGGDIPLSELNTYLYSYSKSLPNKKDAKFTSNNSIWFRDDEERLQVEADFLQKNADYFSADAYKAAFDESTLADINKWVDTNTDGMIDKILDEIDDDAVMYLLNAIVFDAKWENEYDKFDINASEFTSSKGEKQSVEMMYADEYIFLKDDYATGFIKNYKGGDYAFAALLPNENVTLEEYIKNMSGENLLETLKNPENTYVNTGLPKFSEEYGVVMNDMLKSLGIPYAFDSKNADFSKMATSSRGNIYIGEVLHKTFIQVDETGTKAGAVTKVEMKDESALVGETVILDRPFLYMIIDNSTKLPIFIGSFVGIE